MSRLHEIIENHDNLDQLFGLVKHYGVNAEYLSAALLDKLRQEAQNEQDKEKTEHADMSGLIEDLQQFSAQF